MKHILIVDRTSVFRERIAGVLQAERYRTRVACNAREAILALTVERPDAVLLDMDMRGVGDVLRHIQTLPFVGLPVIALSAASDRAKVVAARRLGARAYLLKTALSQRRLLDEVAAVLAAPGASAGPVPSAARPIPEDDRGVASLEPVASRSEILALVEGAKDVKGFSPAASQVLNLTEDPGCSLDRVAKAVAQDHAAVLKVLKLANSPVYACGTPTDSVQMAIVRIGLERIRHTMLGIAMMERFGSATLADRISTLTLWEHSIACGVIASELARAAGDANSETAFTAGLLHDVGRAVLAERLGDRYARVIAAAERLQAPLEAVELRMLGVTHADVMEGFLQAWGLPRPLRVPVVLHHTTLERAGALAGGQVADVHRLALANRLAHALLLGTSGNDTIYPTWDLAAALRIGGETIRPIASGARAKVEQTRAALLPGGERGLQAHASRWRSALGSFRPLYCSLHPEIDAIRLFLSQVAEPVDDATPDALIVHIGSAEEEPGLAAMVAEAARNKGCHDQPIIVVSPAPEIDLDASVLPNAPRFRLGTPFTVARFVATMNAALGRARAAA